MYSVFSELWWSCISTISCLFVFFAGGIHKLFDVSSDSLAYNMPREFPIFRPPFVIRCLRNFNCLILIIFISLFLYLFIFPKTSSLVTCSVHGILCIRRLNHVTIAFSLSFICKEITQNPQSYIIMHNSSENFSL